MLNIELNKQMKQKNLINISLKRDEKNCKYEKLMKVIKNPNCFFFAYDIIEKKININKA